MRDLQKGRQLSSSADALKAVEEPASSQKQPKAELSSLVRSLKRKVGAKGYKRAVIRTLNGPKALVSKVTLNEFRICVRANLNLWCLGPDLYLKASYH